jgi:uncharacterized protein with PIN domain
MRCIIHQTLPELSAKMDGEESPRFEVDGMLGSLARWLRLLGYDADYDNRRDDAELVRLARAENRVLLTRDRELAARRGVQALFIVSQVLDEQLAQVTAAFPRPEESEPARCPVCNTALVPATPEELADRLPAYVLRKYRDFRRCPGCGRVYWPGSHWRNMQIRLRRRR